MEWDFDFTVSNVPRQTAELIMSTVTALVESAGGQIGGGFVETEDGDETVLEEGADGEENA